MKPAAAVLLMAVLTGCGSSSSDEFSKAGNAICRDLRKTVRAIDRPKIDTLHLTEQSVRGSRARAELAKYNAAVSRAARRILPRLRALEPPARLRAKRDEFFAEIASLGRLAKRSSRAQARLTAAIRHGDRKAIDSAITAVAVPARQSLQANQRIDADARALGWTACAAVRS